MSPWLRIIEGWLIARLLASPTFHRTVEKVHKRVRQMRHGPDPEEMSGTNLEKPGEQGKKFLDHYFEELKDQFRGGSSGSKK